mgnify:FL=1
MIDIVSAIATICSLYGNYLVIKKNKFGFVIWLISNILWILINFIGVLNISQVIMFVIYGILNVYGWIKWKQT